MSQIFDKQSKGIDSEQLVTWLLRIATYLIILAFVLIIGRIIVRGAPVLAKEGISFITQSPDILYCFYDQDGKYHRLGSQEYRDFKTANPDGLKLYELSANYSGGGIFGPLMGTLILIGICIVFAMTIGIAASVFLSEYSKRGPLIRMIRLAIINLAGVPSVVFGLFGFAFFCYFIPVITKTTPVERSIFFTQLPDWMASLLGAEQLYLSCQGWGSSILAAGCTLACMVLPIIITACEESLRAVPQGFRDASLSLGATQWQTIGKSVLPYALPGMLTASVLGLLRVSGETAPIMYTGAFAQCQLPWEGLREENWFWRITEFFQRGCEALPYHIYSVSAKIPQTEIVRPMQDGSVLVFMLIMLALATTSVVLRIRIRKKLKW